MGRLTTKQVKLHQDAEKILRDTRKYLPWDDIHFVLENWSPSVVIENNAAFFTPVSLAYDFAFLAAPSGGMRVVDLGAGIGTLAGTVAHLSHSGDIREMTCVEYESRYLQIGKRLFPDFHWVFGNMYEEMFIKGKGEYAISNPPFGLRPPKSDWMKFHPCTSHIKAIELAIRYCEFGATMILPQGLSGYDLKEHKYRSTVATIEIDKNFPGWTLVPIAKYDHGTFIDTPIAVEVVDVSEHG